MTKNQAHFWCSRCGREFFWDYEHQEKTGSGRWIPCECGAKCPAEDDPFGVTPPRILMHKEEP